MMNCYSDELMEAELAKNPQNQAILEVSEQGWQAFANSSPKRTGGPVIIPVVVHIIQETPINKIGMDRVMTQLRVMNEDFRKITGTPGDGIGVDTGIEFCLASIDPNGCPTTGVNRIVNRANARHDINNEMGLKSLIQWDPHKYLNIWVPVSISDNILGYAVFPTWLAGSPERDGIVVHGQYFGTDSTNYNNFYWGRTATHEVGHWLGLYHTFQGGCAGTDTSNCASAGDRVCDTPPVLEPNYGCPVKNSCTETPVDLPDIIENYMDYSYGRCMNMFTQGQTDRMMYHLATYRPNLTSAANLAATGCDGGASPFCTPVAAFESDVRIACVGETVNFSDFSSGPAVAWNWEFTGAVPAVSTQENPSVVYAAPGTYPVKLRVSNSAGADSLTQTTWIQVVNPQNIPLVEGFESAGLPTDWSTVDLDSLVTWELSANASNSGSQSYVSRNYINEGAGSWDDLITAPFSLSGVSGASLSFSHAYRRRVGLVSDSLIISVSTDCGSSWTEVWRNGGAYLSTVAGNLPSMEFVPDSSQWLDNVLDISAFAGNSNVKVRFRCLNFGGQSLYLDDINISGAVNVNSVQSIDYELSVVPNPVMNSADILLENAAPGTYRFVLRSPLGMEIWRQETNNGTTGNLRISVPESVIQGLSDGIYFVEMRGEKGAKVVKLIRI